VDDDPTMAVFVTHIIVSVLSNDCSYDEMF